MQKAGFTGRPGWRGDYLSARALSGSHCPDFPIFSLFTRIIVCLPFPFILLMQPKFLLSSLQPFLFHHCHYFLSPQLVSEQSRAERVVSGGAKLRQHVIHKDNCGSTQNWHCVYKAQCQPDIPVLHPVNHVFGSFL